MAFLKNKLILTKKNVSIFLIILATCIALLVYYFKHKKTTPIPVISSSIPVLNQMPLGSLSTVSSSSSIYPFSTGYSGSPSPSSGSPSTGYNGSSSPGYSGSSSPGSPSPSSGSPSTGYSGSPLPNSGSPSTGYSGSPLPNSGSPSPSSGSPSPSPGSSSLNPVISLANPSYTNPAANFDTSAGNAPVRLNNTYVITPISPSSSPGDINFLDSPSSSPIPGSPSPSGSFAPSSDNPLVHCPGLDPYGLYMKNLYSDNCHFVKCLENDTGTEGSCPHTTGPWAAM